MRLSRRITARIYPLQWQFWPVLERWNDGWGVCWTVYLGPLVVARA